MMDILLTKYSLIDLANNDLQELAIKSGIIKKSDVDEASEESLEELKND